MSIALRPRRSVLYMPAANTRALEKARTLAADALIFDLEDAVSPDAKDAARANACAAASSGTYGKREIVIRANALNTPWGKDDLAAIAKSGAHAVLLPKVDGATEVTEALAALDKAGAAQSLMLWCMIETPLAILRLEEIAAHDRVSCFVMGTNDLVKDLRAQFTPDQIAVLTSLSQTVLVARAYGKVVLDGVYNDIQNLDGFKAQCRQGLAMGFDGKTLVHPSQIEPCNEIFAPSAQEVERARKIIDGFERAKTEGKGVVTVDGRMVEALHVELAKRTLAVHAAIAELAHG
ncbi:MAG: CoA ester lyase [Rhodospirillales bacterium]